MITEKDLNQYCKNITNCPICNNQIKKYISDKNIKYVYCANGQIYKDVNVADRCFGLNNRIFEDNLVSIKLERYIMLSSKILDFRYNIYKKLIIFNFNTSFNPINLKKEFITIQDLIDFCVNKTATMSLLK